MAGPEDAAKPDRFERGFERGRVLGQGRDELRTAVEQAVEKAMRKLDGWCRMRSEEQMAGALLADILGARWSDVEPRDLGGERVHDFDLILRDGRRIAVEVTRDESPADRAFGSATAQTFPLPAPSLKFGWSLDANPPGDNADDHSQARPHSKRLAAELPDILCGAERLGIARLADELAFIAPYAESSDTGPVRETKARLRRLGITRATPYAPAPGAEAEIYVETATPARWSSAHSIRQAVERHLPPNRDDNLDKLAQAKTGPSSGPPADESHLFIWLPVGSPSRSHAADPAIGSAVTLADLDNETPALHGLDTVWVAIHGESNSKAGRPLLPVLRLGADGWSRYECVWQRIKQDTGL